MDSILSSIMTFSKGLTWTNLCKGGAFLLGAHMLQIGTWAYTSPRSLCKAFGLRFDGHVYSPLPTNQAPSNAVNNVSPSSAKSGSPQKGGGYEDTQVDHFWPMLFAAREVGFGVALLVMGGLGEWRAVGITMMIVAGLLATTDGMVAGLYGKGGWSEAMKSHGLPGIILGAMASVLLAA